MTKSLVSQEKLGNLTKNYIFGFVLFHFIFSFLDFLIFNVCFQEPKKKLKKKKKNQAHICRLDCPKDKFYDTLRVNLYKLQQNYVCV